MKTTTAKILTIVLGILIGAAILYFIRIRIYTVHSKTFSCDNMTIQLDTSFKETNNPTMTATYSNNKATIMIGHLPNPDMTFSDYTQHIFDGINALENTSILEQMQTTEKRNLFTYNASEENGSVNVYRTFFYETNSGFWTIQFVCNSSAYEKQLPTINNWEKTVEFH